VVVVGVAVIAPFIFGPSSLLMKWLLPHGRALHNSDHPKFSPVDPTIKNLSIGNDKLTKIYERVGNDGEVLLDGPETILFDDDGTMYAFVKGGQLIRLDNFEPGSNTVLATVIATLPMLALGAKFVPNTKVIYFAVPILGLCRIDVGQRYPKVELIASKVKLDDGTWSQITYADDVDIGPKTGFVYFSDASDISPARSSAADNSPSSWDVIYASVLDALRAKRTGRLLRYDPTTEEVQVLASGIWFANGIAVMDPEETSILISETYMQRPLRYHITGPMAGSLEVIADGLVGMLDGADCNHRTKLCYVPIVSPTTTLVKVLYSRFMPRLVEKWLRTLLMIVPSSLAPKPQKYGGFLELSPFSSSTSSKSRITRVFQDPTGENISLITGVTEYGGKLYLGSLHHQYIGVYDLGLDSSGEVD